MSFTSPHKTRRKHLGLTLEQCAIALATSRQVLGKIENGRSNSVHLLLCYELLLGLQLPACLFRKAVLA